MEALWRASSPTPVSAWPRIRRHWPLPPRRGVEVRRAEGDAGRRPRDHTCWEAARRGGAASQRRRWRGGCAAAGLFFFLFFHTIFFKKKY